MKIKAATGDPLLSGVLRLRHDNPPEAAIIPKPQPESRRIQTWVTNENILADGPLARGKLARTIGAVRIHPRNYFRTNWISQEGRMKDLCVCSRRAKFVLCLAVGLGLCLFGPAAPRALAQYTPAYPNAFDAGCNGNHIDRTSGFNAEARIDPEWAQVTSTPTILEGTVSTPAQKFPTGEAADNQAPSEVAETDIPWTHYTHDMTFVVQPDPEYQSLLSSWMQVEIDANGNIVSQQTAGHHTNMEVEWDNGSTMYEVHASSPYFDYQRGAIPEFVWPSVGNRIWVEGQYIFDCGHPSTPGHSLTIGGFTFDLHYKEEVEYSTEIHPPRALVTYRLNHPLTLTPPLTADTMNAAELPGGDWLPVTGQQTQIPVTQADIFVSARGGGAVDHCSLITRHIDAIDGLLSLGLTGFDSCTHTGPIQTVNDRNYVFDIYPPGTDYSTKTNGLFPVNVPTRDGSGHDVSLQWRVIDHTSDITDNLGNTIKTVTASLCPIDATTGPPTQSEMYCPQPPAYPTRLRVILPFNGALDANGFAASVLLGWDDVPAPQEPAVRSFNIRLEDFQVDHNGEGFLHHGHGDWRVFVDVGGQRKYVSGLPFDRNGNGDNACHGDSLTNMDDNDCFFFHGQPWTLSVLDGNPIHIAVGGWESDSVDDNFCTDPTGCDPSTDAGIALALEDNDRIGTLEFDLDPAQGYQYGVLNTGGVDRLGPIEFHTPQAAGDQTNFYVTFSVDELSPAAAPSSTLSVGSPSYTAGTTFVTSGTPITLATTSTDDVGFQYRFHRDGVPLPSFSSSPFPVHWTTTDFAVGPRTVPLLLNANDGADGLYLLQYSAQTADGATEPRNTSRLTLDNTPPVAAITQPTATQYPHSATLRLGYTESDGSGSGVKSFTPKMDGATTLPDGRGLASGQNINLLTELSLGTHTFSVDSVDNLNNAGTNSVTFSVIVTPDSIKQDVTQFLQSGAITNSGNANSLLAKLNAAAAARARGNCSTAANLYQAFIQEVQALSGKKINPTAAQIMILDAQYLIAHCP